ncbi:MAG: 50S ribosomal protein L30 [Culicoidibacterales bacterium]
MNKLNITLTRSAIGAKPKQKATIQALGLKKMQQTVTLVDSAATRGMIAKVAHLVTVTEA